MLPEGLGGTQDGPDNTQGDNNDGTQKDEPNDTTGEAVNPALEAIECGISKTFLTVGEKATIKTEFTPSNPSNTILNYSSSNEKIASVDKGGVITALSRGTAIITVTSDFNESIKDTIEITVKNRDAMDLGTSNIQTLGSRG